MSAFVMGAWAAGRIVVVYEEKSRGVQRAIADLLSQVGARRLLTGGNTVITLYDICDICGRQIEGDHKRLVITSREMGVTRCVCEECGAKLDSQAGDQAGRICRVEK